MTYYYTVLQFPIPGSDTYFLNAVTMLPNKFGGIIRIRMNFSANRIIMVMHGITYPLLSVLLVYLLLVGLLGALILEIFWYVIVVNLKGSC